jgi:multidrug efflux pump subunit AcrB
MLHERESIEQVQDLMLRGTAEDGKPGPIVRLRDVADIGPEKLPTSSRARTRSAKP